MSLPIRRKFQPKGITILYDDADILVIDKSAGLLTIGTDKERFRTAYALMTDYVKKGTAKSKARLWIVHRLDQDTSGVLVLAKSESVKLQLQNNWDQVTKKYLAIAHGKFVSQSGEFRSYLTENQYFKVFSTNDTSLGKLAVTKFVVKEEHEGLSLLELELVTGRKHQIRAHLAESGHPIYGDTRYGQPDPAAKRMALHAQSITLIHPRTKESMTFEAKTPGIFQHLMGR
ncbi:MAG: RluA family pseudouridine synthase [bacterium]|nr:RluA family pseudouridine synthase [bacterium]